jgi:hypothetical protein
MNLTQRTSQGERTPPAPVRAYDPFRGTGALYSIAYHGSEGVLLPRIPVMRVKGRPLVPRLPALMMVRPTSTHQGRGLPFWPRAGKTRV